MTNAVIYARYSSDSQREESIEGQLEACRSYAKANDLIVINEYIDRAESARSDKRQAFQQMVADSDSRQFDTVLVYQFDRFARNRHDSAIYKNRLRNNGVRVVSAKENIPDDPSGIMLEGMLEALAEYYSADLAQKIRRGQSTNAEKARYNGGVVPLGYKVNAEKRFEIEDVEAAIVQTIFADYEKGATIKDIVAELNKKGVKSRHGTPFKPNSLQKILRNRRYMGIYIYGDIEVPGGMPRIIDDSTFQVVQQRLKVQACSPQVRGKYLLTTKLYCGHCKSMMVGVSGTSKTGRTYGYYTCNRTNNKKCQKSNVRQDRIEEAVIQACRNELTEENIDLLAKRISELSVKETDSPFIKQLEKEIGSTETAIENLLKALEVGEEADLLLQRIKDKREAKEQMEQQLARERLSSLPLEENEIRFFFTKMREGSVNDEKYRKMLVSVLINKIYLYDDYLDIFFSAGGEPVKVTPDLLEEADRALGSYSNNNAPPNFQVQKSLDLFAIFGPERWS